MSTSNAEYKKLIGKRNLDLLEKSEINSSYYLEKLFNWLEDYSDKTKWEDFKYCWFYCDNCNKYSEAAKCDCI